MEPRTFTLGPASCRVRRSNLLSEHMLRHVRELCDLFVPEEHRRQGHATALLNEVCKAADEADLVLLARPPQDAMPMLRRFGFSVMRADPLLMARNPGTTPAPDISMTQVAYAVRVLLQDIARKSRQSQVSEVQ